MSLSACQRASLLPLPVLLALLGACSPIREGDWRFGLSRSAYPQLFEKMDDNEPLFEERVSGGGVMELLLLPLLMALPLALDLVALPVTCTHDCLD